MDTEEEIEEEAMSLSYDNLIASRLYFDQTGKLWVVYNMYWVAGSGVGEHMLELDDYKVR